MLYKIIPLVKWEGWIHLAFLNIQWETSTTVYNSQKKGLKKMLLNPSDIALNLHSLSAICLQEDHKYRRKKWEHIALEN